MQTIPDSFIVLADGCGVAEKCIKPAEQQVPDVEPDREEDQDQPAARLHSLPLGTAELTLSGIY